MPLGIKYLNVKDYSFSGLEKAFTIYVIEACLWVVYIFMFVEVIKIVRCRCWRALGALLECGGWIGCGALEFEISAAFCIALDQNIRSASQNMIDFHCLGEKKEQRHLRGKFVNCRYLWPGTLWRIFKFDTVDRQRKREE